MAFKLLRFGSRISLDRISTINISSAHITFKRSLPTTSSMQCSGGSCPLDLTKLSSGNKSNLIPSAQFSITKRNYSKRAASEREQNQKDESDSDSESDSDTERKGLERSDFWRRKMRTFHGLLDLNKDGVISYDDYQILVKRFSDLGHLNEEQAEEFASVVRLTWEEQLGEISPYNLVTVEQYLADMDHVLNDKQLKKRVHNFLPYIFKAVDKDKSGFISVNEFKLFFKCLGLTEETAAISFAIIDKNGDGKLSTKEFVKLGKDFFFSDDERRVSKMFWGPLIDH
ncbi:sarcoplasmic calcium-binding protein isoform X2 [Arctopsyche grandis]|uniref:sarcoplasmic calcium-binding protein isoform X2 n=1 Tax=Arctopsyche grandis TaxID=121162 RepID=UPI00406D90A2